VRSVLSSAIIVAIASAQLAAEMSQQSGERPSAADLSSPTLLRAMLYPVLRDSGLIFSGTVLKVEHRNSDSSSALATTRIHFRVDEAIRNVRHGQVVEVKEWGGLWQSGERYHPGERVLLFLYSPSKLGLTSPVGGTGCFPLDRAGRVLFGGRTHRTPRPIEIRRVVAAIRQAEKE
jgi:hypothetical protein